MKKYTVNFFIKKFSKIPSERWTTGSWIDFDYKRCAEGFCSSRIYPNGQNSPQANALDTLFHSTLKMRTICINDNSFKKQHTPKKRILLALKLAKKKLQKKGLVNHDFRKSI